MPPKMTPQPLGRGDSGFANELSASISAATNKSPTTARSATTSSMLSDTKRKQTLLTILEALHELQDSPEIGLPTLPSRANTVSGARQKVEDELEDPMMVNESLQKEGADAFMRFQRRIKDLDKELRSFANATRQLGSSVGILNSATHLRHNLYQVHLVFRENAAELFPNKVKRPNKETIEYTHRRKKHPARRHHQDHQIRKIHKRNPHLVSALAPEDLEPEHIPSLFDQLAKEVVKFHDRLNEFPEFSDESVNTSLMAFAGDLKYWADTLEEYKGQFKYPSVGSYLHDLSSEMGEHLDHITQSLGTFVEVGVPTIRFVQKHGASNLQNLSTVATFFSAVTATTLQFSFNLDSDLAGAVNSFWFASLVFSIASAVNSLLGLTWKQAMYRSPGHRVPWWVLIWIKRSPLIFLVVSIAAFLIGLVIFTYASSQFAVTKIITTVFTAFTSFGLAAVSLWFAFEKWTYSRHYGQRWLAEILSDMSEKAMKTTGMKWLSEVTPKQTKKVYGHTSRYIKRLSNTFHVSKTSQSSSSGDIEDGLPLPVTTSDMPPANATLAAAPHLHAKQLSEASLFKTDAAVPGSPDSEKAVPGSLSGSILFSSEPLSTNHPNLATTGVDTPPPRTGKQLWINATRMAIMSRSLTRPSTSTPRMTKRQMTTSSIPSADGKSRRDSMEPYTNTRHQRLLRVISTLGKLEIAQEFDSHQALIRHLQFSSDGKWLATCSWDRTSHLFKVSTDGEEPCTPHKVLPHPTGFAGQVAWSPDGSYLLTKLTRSIKVWTAEGVRKNTIERPRLVQSIAWMPHQEGHEPAFMSVEGSAVCTVDIHGKELAAYELDRLQIYDVAVTPDAKRFLGVATLLESKDKLKPVRARPENRIVVYNLEEKQIESQVPVLNEVRDITLGSDGMIALVSYENMAPPQLWRLQMVRDDVRLSLIRTFMPQKPVLWAGASYFGGSDDQLVLCAGKGGDVHIWDRETGKLLHHFRAQDQSSGDLTALAWNPLSSGTFMLATGTHDGILKIWTATLPSRDDTESDSETGSISGSSRAASPEPMLDSERQIVESPQEQREYNPLDMEPPQSPTTASSSGARDMGQSQGASSKDKDKRSLARLSSQIGRTLHFPKMSSKDNIDANR